MAKKIYVAASFEMRETVKDLHQKLIDQGHIITADWTDHKHVNKMPASVERTELGRQYAIEDTKGVEDADVFVLLLSDRKGMGSHIELGIALGAQCKIYIVGKDDGSQLFYKHPRIEGLATVDELLDRVK